MRRPARRAQGAFEYILLLAGILLVVTLAILTLRGSLLAQTNAGIARSVNTFLGLTYPCAFIPTGIVSWWPGDGNANDIVDSNPGTLVGGATFAAGKVGQAFSLNGAGAYVDVGTGISFSNLPRFTIDAWIKLNSPVPAGTFYPVATQPNVVDFVDLQINVNVNQQLETKVGNGLLYTGTTVLQPGVFYHVALTKDITGNVKLYLNGNLEVTGTAGVLDTTNQHLVIGKWFRHFDTLTAYFNGLIDEVEVFNRDLSATEIQNIFNAGSLGKCHTS